MRNIIAFCLIIGLVVLTNAFTSPVMASELERRDLAQFPKFSIEEMLNGNFSKDFSEYVSDQFPGRNFFRGIKTYIQVELLNRVENNGVYIKDDNLYGKFDEINYERIDSHIKNINKIIANSKNDVYFSLIPSKIYNTGLPGIDQEILASYISNNVNATYLDQLDYYLRNDAFLTTDPHWTQRDALSIYNDYLKEHLIKSTGKNDYIVNALEVPYMGTLFSSLGGGHYEDYLEFYSNEVIDDLTVCINTGVEECQTGPYFNNGNTLYDNYLNGNNPIVTIYNDSVEENELIVFRDSFGNAIAPFIAEDYSKVTFIDLRLVRMEYIYQNIDLESADIMFLYNIKTMNDDFRLTN